MQKNRLATIITAPLLMLSWTPSCHAADATAPTEPARIMAASPNG